MNAGDFRQRLKFRISAGEKDEDGYPILEPKTYTSAWGKLETLRGHTRFIAAQTEMQHNREFTIRYQKKLEDENRPKNLVLYWKGKEHKIESIENDDGLNVTMTVLCKAVT